MIVNYGTADLTIQCVTSLNEIRDECSQLIVSVVDNASPDDSADRIEAAIQQSGWADWVTLVRAPRNGGFAYGNNVGIRDAFAQAHVDAVWLLNSDTIVRKGALSALFGGLQHPSGGIVGSRLEDPDGSAQRSAFRFQTVSREWASGLNLGLWFRCFPSSEVAPKQEDRTSECDWLAGASMLIKREVIEDIGLLDDGYFLYFEEVDYCLRAARHGWKTVYVPASRVVHLVGQSSGVTNNKDRLRPLPVYWFESRARFFRQNYGRATRFTADCCWLAGHLLFRVRCAIQHKRPTLHHRILRDFVRYNFWWPSRV